MTRLTRYLGIGGLVVLCFGLIAAAANYDRFHLAPLHFGVGLVLLLVFLLSGGVRYLGQAALKRAAGFGMGVVIYSSLFVGILIVANVFAARFPLFYYDSTEAKVYTLAPQTQSVFSSLEHELRIRGFYVGYNIEPETKRLLDRIGRVSSKVRWELLDPEKVPALAKKLGISETKVVHLALETPDGVRETKISGQIGEEELVNSVLKLTRRSRVVYYLKGYADRDLDNDQKGGFSRLKEAIEGENIAVKSFSPGDTPIAEDAAAVLLMAPERELLPSDREKIRTFLRRGGNAVFMAEPRTTREIADLVEPLGIVVGEDVIVDRDVKPFSSPGLGVQPLVTLYGRHPIVEGFDQATVYSTSCSVRRKESLAADAAVVEIAKTGPDSWAERNLDLLYSSEPRAALDEEDIKGPVSLAVAAQVAPADDVQGEAVGSGRVVVFGDIDFVSNINIHQLFNRDLVLNALNWVVGEEKRVSIRARTLRGSRQIITADQFSAVFSLTGILFPEVLLLFGLAVWWFRKD